MFGESVRERQNEQRSLDRLIAQRLLYGHVKTVENWRLTFVLLVAAMLLWGLAVDAGPFSHLATIFVLSLWFVDQVCLVRLAGSLKVEAAAIQEDFDCFVLDLPWPEYAGFERPTQDRVDELAKKGERFAHVRENLENWYGVNIPEKAIAARLFCQRTNCRWDKRLRKEWMLVVYIALAILGFVCLVVATLAGVSILKLVLAVAAGLRLVAWLVIEHRAQSFAKKRMENLHGYLSRVCAESHQMTLCDVLLVQGVIYEHRRLCPTVPDWFYRIRRSTYERMELG